MEAKNQAEEGEGRRGHEGAQYGREVERHQDSQEAEGHVDSPRQRHWHRSVKAGSDYVATEQRKRDKRATQPRQGSP